MPSCPKPSAPAGRWSPFWDGGSRAFDDGDTYVSRPHAPGEIAAALLATSSPSPVAGASSCGSRPSTARCSGLHLGMAGRIVVDGGDDVSPYDRFAVEFEDGTRFALRDKRRLGRAVLNPDFSHVGPDAADVGRDEFRAIVGAGHTAVKARLLNQHALSGVGNLLADQVLWQARISPQRSTADLSVEELDRLRRELRRPSARRSARAGSTPARSSPPAAATVTVRATATRWRAARWAAHHLLVPGLPALTR